MKTESRQETPLERQGAPEGLALVQDFVNSAKLPGGFDELVDIAAAEEWLAACGFVDSITEGQRLRMVKTREYLRNLLEVNSGHEFPEDSAIRLSRILDGVHLHPCVTSQGISLSTKGEGLEGFLGTLLKQLVTSTLDESFLRLKVCKAENCQWTFFDYSKNGGGSWCSMRSCGSRAKSKAYRERQRQLAT